VLNLAFILNLCQNITENTVYKRKYSQEDYIFYIQRHTAPVKHITPEDHEIINTSSASWKKCYKLYKLILSAY